MRRLLLLLFVFIAFRGFSQQNRFAYFQAAANEPFYIRMEEKTFSSNAFGSLVIAKLKDSTYKLYIGFPKNKSSEQLFQVPISGSDRGFELKRGSNGSIRLFDWQKNSYIDAATPQTKTTEAPTQAKTDTYSKLMAAVVDDPAVATIAISVPMEEPALVKAETIPGSTDTINNPVAVSTDTPVAINKEAEKNIEHQKLDTIRPVKQEITLPPAGTSAPVVAVAVGVQSPLDTMKSGKDTARLTDSSKDQRDTAGTIIIPPAPVTNQLSRVSTLSDTVKENYREMIFVDKDGSSNDTINIIIPMEVQISKPADTGLYRVKEAKPDTTKTVSNVQLINSDCKRFASDSDVDKLRVSILNANSNDTKVQEARNVFKSRCFSTRQIRALSELFSSDDGRYKLFDAAYPYVSDSSNFKTLVDLLEDSFYVNRFKTLARIQD